MTLLYTTSIVLLPRRSFFLPYPLQSLLFHYASRGLFPHIRVEQPLPHTHTHTHTCILKKQEKRYTLLVHELFFQNATYTFHVDNQNTKAYKKKGRRRIKEDSVWRIKGIKYI